MVIVQRTQHPVAVAGLSTVSQFARVTEGLPGAFSNGYIVTPPLRPPMRPLSCSHELWAVKPLINATLLSRIQQVLQFTTGATDVHTDALCASKWWHACNTARSQLRVYP